MCISKCPKPVTSGKSGQAGTTPKQTCCHLDHVFSLRSNCQHKTITFTRIRGSHVDAGLHQMSDDVHVTFSTGKKERREVLMIAKLRVGAAEKVCHLVVDKNTPWCAQISPQESYNNALFQRTIVFACLSYTVFKVNNQHVICQGSISLYTIKQFR